MRYMEFRAALKTFTVFSLNEIKKIDKSFHRRRLTEWQEKGYIKKIIKGYYIFSEVELNESVLFEIANRIQDPSYISLEVALSYYHLIPENVYRITSVSSRRPCNLNTPIAEFNYRKIKPGLFFGYQLIPYNGKYFKIGQIEKIVLDYFYLHPHLKSESDFDSLRINPNRFWSQLNEVQLNNYLEKFSCQQLTKTIKSFLEFMRNA